MNIFKSDKPVDLSEHMLRTYHILRIVLVVIAFAFPVVLSVGGFVSKDRLPLQRSLSAYYHAYTPIPLEVVSGGATDRDGQRREAIKIEAGRGVMRNWFVGVLFAISALLAVYKGFRPAEDLALNLAAIFATLVALFPSAYGDAAKSASAFSFHGAFAICFFLCIAYVCIFCASATLSLVREDRRARYRRSYKLLGWLMVVSPVLAAILNWSLPSRIYFIFFAEAFGVYAFASYWLVKTLEISETKADQKAAKGELQLPPGEGASDAVRQIPVTQKQPALSM